MSVYPETRKRVTTDTLRKMKKDGEKIAMLTAYDYTTSRILDIAGVDVILVGDSAANVMAGYETTLPITLDQMIYHGQCVVRGIKNAMVVVDLPFGTYSDPRKALDSAIRVIKETGANAVKVEGGKVIMENIEKIVNAGIPVMGHLGLTPQSINQLGNYKIRAKENIEAEQLKKEAKMLEEMGCFSLVLEKIPSTLAKEVSNNLNIPTIGIGAGVHCDGQVLVYQDMVGMNDGFNPKFLRKYEDLYSKIKNSVQEYVKDVKTMNFPSTDESY